MKITEFVSEDWQKTNRKDRTSGMSRKAVKAYRRENPGSKLQTAVTTKPSKLKKGSKSAKRRKSFCARMRGMKKSRTSAKTARNPNSNINKALRRWNCESIEQMQELVMIAEQKIAALKQGMAEGFDELDAYIKDKQAVKPRGGAGIKRGSYGTGERKTGYSGKTVGLTPYGTGSAIPSNRDFGKPHSIPRAAPRGIDDFDANHRKVDELGVAEATGDPKFDKMLKGITSKRQVAKQQRADTKQQARDAFGGMFGGGNPADKLSIRKKGVSEEQVNEFLDDRKGGDDDGEISKIVSTTDRLLKQGYRVDLGVVGAMGRVYRADLTPTDFTPNGALAFKRKTRSFMRPFIADDDDKYAFEMVAPKHYKIVDVWPDEQGVAEGKDDLSQYSTERLKAYVKKVSGGGVPAFGSGAKLKRVEAELKRRESGVAEGIEPGHREIERWATQSEENQKIYNAYIKAGKMADEAYKQKDGAAYTGLQLRKKQIRDLIAKKMSEQGVAEGFERFQVGDKISFPLSQMATGIVDKIDDKRLYVKLDNGEVYTIPSTMLHSVKLLERQGVAEGQEDIVAVIDGVRSNRTYNDRYHAHNSLSKLVGYGKAKVAELYINGEKVEHFELGKKYIDFEPKQLDAMSEAGAFSYGVKKPRKGSVADLAAKKRKEQERGMQPVEPRDHMVGIARVKK